QFLLEHHLRDEVGGSLPILFPTVPRLRIPAKADLEEVVLHTFLLVTARSNDQPIYTVRSCQRTSGFDGLPYLGCWYKQRIPISRNNDAKFTVSSRLHKS